MDISKKAPTTLAELINYFGYKTQSKSKVDFHIYEMGRGIKQINKTLFADFEAATTAWPYPFLKSAWLALFFNDPELADSSSCEDFHVWFLKFPLDEQGLLVQSARDAYLKQFFDQVIRQQSQTNTALNKNIPLSMPQSPYGFTPSKEKMANINAIIKHQLNKLPSQYYQDVLHYLYQLEHKDDHWQTLGYQGLADLSCYMHNQYKNKTIEDQLAQIVEQLPIEMLKALSTCLEHHQLSGTLETSIKSHAQAHNQPEIMTACLRSISASKNSDIINELIKQALKSDYRGNIELLAVICGRCWNNLKEPWLMILFLEALALNTSEMDAFNIMVSDLLFIPGMRDTVLEQFRNPQRSTQLTIAIGDFYSSR